VRSIVTECPDVRAWHGKAPLGSCESTCPTSNGVNFRDGKDNRAAGRHYRCARNPWVMPPAEYVPTMSP
jgi:hypothetical protein